MKAKAGDKPRVVKSMRLKPDIIERLALHAIKTNSAECVIVEQALDKVLAKLKK